MSVDLLQRKRKAAVEEVSTSDGATNSSSSSTGSGSGSDKDSPPPQKKQKLPPTSSELKSKEVGKVKNKTVQGERGGPQSSVSRPDCHTAMLADRQSDGQKVLEVAQSRKVYKSLFNSSSSERPRQRTSNWVTYFPYH